MEELQEIIHRRPVWVIRWGTALFLLILAAFFAMTFFIRFPQMMRSPLLISRTASGDFYGRLDLPRQCINHIGIGQTVTVQVAGYPPDTYGYLNGEFAFPVSDIAVKTIPVLIRFPTGLITTRGQHLTYTERLQGTALIRLADQRLIDRLWQEISFHPHLP